MDSNISSTYEIVSDLVPYSLHDMYATDSQREHKDMMTLTKLAGGWRPVAGGKHQSALFPR
jgi:hypothetical protein